jgi:uncharacterized protein YegL
MEFNTFTNYGTVNFDPAQIANQTSSVIQFIVIADESPSVSGYVGDMNKSLEELFMKELKGCHRKDDIMVKCITFSEDVEHKSGFQPILNLDDNYLHLKARGRGTALYDAVLKGLQESITYREDLEDQGIDVRTAIYIITDGEDNSSDSQSATSIKKIVDDMRSNEAWINSFTISMLGVGSDSSFRSSCKNMGLNPDLCLVTVSTNAQEIRKVLGVVSQSISSSSAASTVSF